MCNEDGSAPAYHVRDARTCAVVQAGPINGADTGRCVADDVDAANPGGEVWASSTGGRLYSATTNANLGPAPGSQNFLVFWDADETRELEDANHVDKYVNGQTMRLLTADGVTSNNGTKSTPALTADLYGDWREEVVWRETNSSALRIYTTVNVTARRIYTLMHDPQYRMQVSAEQTAYNQPPHVGFHIGSGMAAPPVPNIKVR
jgi:rhamnogalacturonan endolyase